MIHFFGQKDAQRRQLVEAGTYRGEPRAPASFQPFRKTSLTYAVRIDEPFEVETIEGLHTGKAGDYLAIGAHGEMYPIDAAVFDSTYEPVK